MNNPVFGRLVWKEYRTQRAFWFALLAMTVFLQILYLAFAEVVQSDRVLTVFSLSLGFAALHAAGVGATLFATEKETGLFDTLRALPLGAGRLFFAKAAYGLVDSAAFLGVAWLAAWLLCGGRMPEPQLHGSLIAGWSMATLELLTWGILFSLLIARPLVAAILAMTAAGEILHFALAGALPWDLPEIGMQSLPNRAIIVALLAAIDAWLGSRWFRQGRQGRQGRWRPFAFAGRAAARSELRESTLAGRSKPQGFGRLVWQQWRQTRLMLGVCGCLAVAVAVMLFSWGYHQRSDERLPELTGKLCIVVWLASALIGVSVFLGDQRQQHYRFLAEHGVAPRAVWRSRQLVGILAVVVLLLAILPVCVAFVANSPQPHTEPSLLDRGPILVPASVALALQQCLLLISVAALSYSAGQFCSLLLRSGLLAGVFGVFLAGGLCLWFGAMKVLEVPLWWSVLPLPVALLAATRLRVNDWLRERNTWRAWLPIALVVAVPLVAVLALVPVYRVVSVPDSDPGFDPVEYARLATPDERATGDLYRRAWYASVHLEPLPDADPPKLDPDLQIEYKISLSDRMKRWLAANEKSLTMALEASGRAECQLYEPSTYQRTGSVIGSLIDLVAHSAEELEIDGKLDAAAERYLAALRMVKHSRIRVSNNRECNFGEQQVYYRLPFWAARPGQTAARVTAMARTLESLDVPDAHRADPIKTDFVITQAAYAGDPVAMSGCGMQPDQHYFVARWMPWEAIRTRRWMRGYTAKDLDQLAWIDRYVRTTGVYGHVPAQVRPDRSTLVLSMIEPTLEASSIVQQEVHLVSVRRMTRLALAVQAWRLEHGSVPKSLDVLVGPVLGTLPVDPQTGRPFLWFPEGQAVQISWRMDTVPAGTPLLYCEQADLSRFVSKSVLFLPAHSVRNDFDERDQKLRLMPVPSGKEPSTPAKPTPPKSTPPTTPAESSASSPPPTPPKSSPSKP